MCLDLDRTNVSNAYVSGMKEELNMVGNDFNVRLAHFPEGPCLPSHAAENQHHLYLWLYRRYDTQCVSCSFGTRTAVLIAVSDNLMLQVVPPRLWFPFMQILWGILTFW